MRMAILDELKALLARCQVIAGGGTRGEKARNTGTGACQRDPAIVAAEEDPAGSGIRVGHGLAAKIE